MIQEFERLTDLQRSTASRIMLTGFRRYGESETILRTLLMIHPASMSAKALIQECRRPGAYGRPTVSEFVRFLGAWRELRARLEPHGMTIMRTDGTPEGHYCISRI